MAGFTKTLIVDSGGSGDYTTIKEAVDYFITNSIGGVIIVEQGTYDIDGTGYKTTVNIPNNVTIIGSGAVILNVTADITVFKNNNQTTGNDRITITGFKIQITLVENSYTYPVIYFKKVKNCIIEKLYILKNTGTITSDAAAIRLEGSGSYGDTSCMKNTISQCSLKEFYSGVGIHLKGFCQSNVIEGNCIEKTSKNIHLEQAPWNNVFCNSLSNPSDGGTIGIHIDRSDRCVISGNEVSIQNGQGIVVEKSNLCSIQGNACHDNKYEGIHLTGISGSASSYNTISGNSCYQNEIDEEKDGLFIDYYAQYNSVSGNSCCENDRDGIHENNSNNNGYNVYNGNVCSGNGGENVNILNLNSITTNNMA